MATLLASSISFAAEEQVGQLVPPELKQNSLARFPATETGIEPSEVELELTVDETGAVIGALVTRSSGPAFDQAALHAATRLEFTPAQLNGKPVSVRLPFIYRFERETRATSDRGPSQAIIRGQVRTKGNRRAIIGAAVRVADETSLETDEQGRFQAKLPPGKYVVQVFAAGHKTANFHEIIRPSESIDVVYSLEPLLFNPYETIIRADRDRMEVARVTLHKRELREVAGTMGDPFRVVMLLPGVGSMASGVAYPVVRGSQPAATGYFLDGVRIPVLFHLLLWPAVVHPDFLQALDFYPGTPPAFYGRLLQGAIDASVSRPRDDRLHATVYADIINTGIFLEAPIKRTNTNFTISGRFSYTPWLLALIGNSSLSKDQKLVLDFYDYQARIEQSLGRGKLRLMGFGSSDVAGVEAVQPTATTTLQIVAFHRLDLRYTHPVGNGEGEVAAGWGFDRIALESGTSGDFGFGVADTGLRARARWKGSLSQRLAVEVGADIERRESHLTIFGARVNGSSVQEFTARVALGVLAGTYLQGRWTINDGWNILAGVRLDSYHRFPGFQYYVAEPRLTVRHTIGDKVTLKAGAGIYHQPPTALVSLPAIDIGGLSVGIQQGIQSDIGAEWKVLKGLEINANIYANYLSRVIEYSFDSMDLELRSVGGDKTRGYAWGAELLIRHPMGGRWFGWLSYSLQHSYRYKRFPSYNVFGNQIGLAGPRFIRFQFDQTHVLNAVLSYKLPANWTVGGVFHLNTGYPEAGGVTSRTHREGSARDGNPAWIPLEEDKVDTLPLFVRLDARVSKSWLFDTFTLEAYLDFFNATLSKEISGFDYNTNFSSSGVTLSKRKRQNPIFVPVLGVKATY